MACFQAEKDDCTEDVEEDWKLGCIDLLVGCRHDTDIAGSQSETEIIAAVISAVTLYFGDDGVDRRRLMIASEDHHRHDATVIV